MTVTNYACLDGGDIYTATLNALSDTLTVPALGTVQSIGFQANGTFVATLTLEATVDGVSWQAVSGVAPSGSSSSTITSSGAAVSIPVGGYQAVRARVSSYTSGAAGLTAVTNGGWLAPPSTTTVVINTSTATLHTLNSAATTNATSVKVSSGSVVGLTVSNVSASVRYFKFYNKTSAPTVGTDTPILTLPIPAGGILNPNVGLYGIRMAGIAYAITGAAADNDTTAIAAGDCKVALLYV